MLLYIHHDNYYNHYNSYYLSDFRSQWVFSPGEGSWMQLGMGHTFWNVPFLTVFWKNRSIFSTIVPEVVTFCTIAPCILESLFGPLCSIVCMSYPYLCAMQLVNNGHAR